MTAPTKVSVRFGALAEPLSDQLRSFALKEDELERLQHRADAITSLYLAHLLTDGEVRKARQRFLKVLVSHIRGKRS